MKDGDKPSLLDRIGMAPKPADPDQVKMSSLILSTTGRRNAKFYRTHRRQIEKMRRPPAFMGAVVDIEDRQAWRKRRCAECGRSVFLRHGSQFLTQHLGRPTPWGTRTMCPSDVPLKSGVPDGANTRG